MFERRLDITVPLKLLSPMHLGTGTFAHRSLKDPRSPGVQKDGKDDLVWVAAVQRGKDGKPALVGTTVKGMLRRLLPADRVEDLCGAISDKGTGQQGRLTAFSALAEEPANQKALACLPHADTRGVYTHARVNINSATGTAADHKLFQAEAVAAGTVFKVSLRLDLRGLTDEAAQNKPINALATALARLCADEGVPCGRGQSQGQGRLRLSPEDLKACWIELGRDGKLEEEPWTAHLVERVKSAEPSQRLEVAATLRLGCDGPYLTVDSSKFSLRGDNRDNAKEGKETAPQINPFVADENTPMVSGSAILGAMRARARWLMALTHVGTEQKDDDPGDTYQPWKADVPETLTPIQRLFGVTGWGGTLRISNLSIVSTDHQPIDLTSVALDQFSGAPLEGALFTTRAHVGVEIRLQLTLDKKRPLSNDLIAQDERFLSELIEDIRTNGLMLGHGTNKGYGWFEVRPDEKDGQAQ